jgi:cobalt/nickel transport system permease protein
MHVHFLDPFQDLRSPVHALDARVKVLLALAFILTVSLTPMGAWPAYALLFALAVAVILLSRLGVRFVLRRALVAVPFTLAALPLLLTGPAPFISIGVADWTISQPGLVRFVSILIKTSISMQIAIVLASTTAFPSILTALRALRLPALFVAIFGLMWRYLFVLADEALRLLRARDSRSGVADGVTARATGGSIAWRARTTGGMAGNLLMRSFERGDRIYDAMTSRGYDGEPRTLRQSNVPAYAWGVLAGGVAVLGLVLALSRL